MAKTRYFPYKAIALMVRHGLGLVFFFRLAFTVTNCEKWLIFTPSTTIETKEMEAIRLHPIKGKLLGFYDLKFFYATYIINEEGE